MRLTTIFTRFRNLRPAPQSARRFHARRRSAFPAQIERVEDRTLLAATILASFTSSLDAADTTTDLRLTVAQTQNETIQYGVNIRPAKSSSFDAGTISIREVGGATVAANAIDNSVNGGLETSAQFNLGPGDYIVSVGGDQSTTGSFLAEVTLLGATGGNSAVTSIDVQTAAASMLSSTQNVTRDLNLRSTLFQNVGYVEDYDLNGDGMVDLADLEIIESNATGGTSTVILTVNNSAPVLDAAGDLMLVTVAEFDPTSVDGSLVSEILASGASGDPISDLDDGALEGIAVVGVNNDNGTWEFDATGGTNFTAFAGPTLDGATLLAPEARVRFVPNSDFFTQGAGPFVDFTFRAWDQTTGFNGAIGVDTSINGGASAFSSDTDEAQVAIDALSLSLNTSANNGTPSNGTVIVQNARFQIDGIADPNATIEVSRDNDDVFDDGTTVADGTGAFSVNVTLTNTADNRGANSLVVRTTGQNTGLQSTQTVSAHLAIGTVVNFDTTFEINGVAQSFDVELFDTAAPLTVAKFLQLSGSDEYRNTIVHRSPGTGFVIQGGGFEAVTTSTPTVVQAINAGATVVNEFGSDRSNVRGTLSTALSNNPDTFDSQWFVNTVDNTGLDNAQHTVFGVVIGQGMDVVDAIDRLPQFDIVGVTGIGALGQTPLVNYSGSGAPTEDNYVIFNSIAAILTPPTATFSVSEAAATGSSVGVVAAQTAVTAPQVFQFEDSTLSNELLLAVDDHFAGDLAASVVLVEYLDFQCPACAAIHDTVQQLEQDFAGELLVVRRHFPLTSVHENAFAAARVAEAAGRQGAFETMGDLLFQNQSDWQAAADPQTFFDGYANQLGLDMTQFAADVADASVDDRINRDLNAVTALGGVGTPTFFLNGSHIANPSSLSEFTSVIQAEVDALETPFAIHRTTGALTVRDSAFLDAQSNPTEKFFVSVGDSLNNREFVSVTVNVT
ncbi:MAG: thioredoxin domain-containing protein [Planctomycetota bacterium]|nr:thioredoxin domain-containing protein [Planctomycetota bacterium]